MQGNKSMSFQPLGGSFGPAQLATVRSLCKRQYLTIIDQPMRGHSEMRVLALK
jgi:hypothetical protein